MTMNDILCREPVAQLEALADLYLDAREWRNEESELLAAYQRELLQQRKTIRKLCIALGEPPPEDKPLPKVNQKRNLPVILSK